MARISLAPLVVLLLLSCLTAGMALAAPAEEVTAESAPYQFAIAKLLLAEGSWPEAMSAFSRALEGEPDDPYLHLEYAELLLHGVRNRRDPGAAREQLQLAARHVDRARAGAPEDPNVLRAVSQAYLMLADHDASAVQVAQEALEELRRLEPWDIQSMVTLGQLYLSQGDPAAAAEVYGEVTSYIPDNRFLLVSLAEARERAGDMEAAEKALAQLLDLDPGDEDARVRLAELLSRRGDHGAALDLLRRAPEEVAREPRVRYLIARELFRSGEPDQALEMVEVLRAGDSRIGRALRFYVGELRSRILASLGREDEAFAELQSLLTLDPGNVELVRRITGSLLRHGRRDDALEVLAEFIARHDGAADPEPGVRDAVETARMAMANLYMESEDWDGAAAALEPLLKSDDAIRRATGAVNLAEVLYRTGRHGDAQDLLKGREKEEPRLVGKRVELLLRDEEEKEARKVLAALGRRDKPEGALAAARAFQALGRFGDTLEVLEVVVDGNPSSVEARFLLGAARERTGDQDRAAVTFERLLDLDPDYAPALNHLGYMWADLGENLDRALELVQRAVSLEPDNGAYVDSLGWAHFRLGNLREAQTHLERAAELVPGDPVVLEHLGDLYAAQGDLPKAARLYEQSLEVADPSDKSQSLQVRRKLADLRRE